MLNTLQSYTKNLTLTLSVKLFLHITKKPRIAIDTGLYGEVNCNFLWNKALSTCLLYEHFAGLRASFHYVKPGRHINTVIGLSYAIEIALAIGRGDREAFAFSS